MTEVLLSVRGLGHSFADRTVLEDLDFDLARGERLAILGPSGCGKTTLLKLIAGLLPVTQGTIRLEGLPPKAGRGSAMIFQTPRLLPWRRAAANVGLVLAHLPKTERAARVAELLDRLGLGDRADSWPEELSGGMQQRLALARALAMDMPLLLLDEPFAALDPLGRERMQDALIDQMAGRAFIVVTHSVDEALTLGDRIVLMGPRPGRILKIMSPTLSGKGGVRRRDPAFYTHLAALSDALRASAG